MIKSFIFWSFLTFWMFLHPTLSQLAEKPKPSLKPHGAIFIYANEGFTPPGAKRGCQCVKNGVIEKVDITGATAYGISLKGSKKNKLTGNSIVNNKGSGIYLSKSEGNTLENNTVKGSGIFGIHLEVSNENALSGNTVV